jgi:hypothetical protein
VRLRPADLAVLALTAGITLFCAFKAYGGRGQETHLVIQGRENTWVYPLSRETRLEIPGPLGLTEVQIHGGGARVVSSPCVNQSCVAAGLIHRRGQWAACLPNGVLLSIEAENPDMPPGSAELDGAVW